MAATVWDELRSGKDRVRQQHIAVKATVAHEKILQISCNQKHRGNCFGNAFMTLAD